MTIRIDPQLQAVLDMMRDGGFPRFGSVSAASLRELTRQPPATDNDVALVRDVEIPGGIPARLYRPAPSAPGLILYFHGGGWTIGDLDTADATLRVLANRTGYTILSVDYRLAPEHPFPAAVDDALAALRWAAASKEELAGVPDAPLIVMGDSAGANLSAAISLLARDLGEVDIALQVLIYPSTEGELDSPGMHAFEPPFLLRDEIAWFFDQYIPVDLRSDPRFAPGKASDHGGLPPAIILVADLDLLADEGRIYARKLQKAGVEVELMEYAGAIHGFFTLPPSLDIVRRAIDDVSMKMTEMVGQAAPADRS